jgi:prephenate dehydrogenase
VDKKVTIIGLGLIGGSIGLALRGLPANAPEIVGFSRTKETAKRALDRGAVNRVETSLTAAVRNANLVVIATPILASRDIFAEIGPHLLPDSVVTDVASTKVAILDWASQLLPSSVDFVGGHPMAGKETSGIDAAEPALFRGCTYCIVPGRNASQKSVDLVTELANSLGGRPLFLSAEIHDYLVAGISHLPFALACTLVMATVKSQSWAEMSPLASSGYRDTSRLASQHTLMSRDICLTNRDNIVSWIDDFTRELQRFRDLLAHNSDELEKTLALARRMRQEWLQGYEKRS